MFALAGQLERSRVELVDDEGNADRFASKGAARLVNLEAKAPAGVMRVHLDAWLGTACDDGVGMDSMGRCRNGALRGEPVAFTAA